MALGVMYVVSTPIGHLGDLSPRALDVLRQVDWVAAEDTRRTRALLAHFGIGKPMLSCHAHNEADAALRLIDELRRGSSVALVSDAGTPCLSDPGQQLIAACHSASVRVVPVPGASAVTAVIAAAGLHTSRFVFEGFLPRDGKQRRERIRRWRSGDYAVVLFEAPSRISATINELTETLGGERLAVLGRELTKLHEQVVRAPLATLRVALAGGEVPLLGEFVVVIDSPGGDAAPVPLDRDEVLAACLQFLPPSQASRLAARLTGSPRGALYDRAIALAPAAAVAASDRVVPGEAAAPVAPPDHSVDATPGATEGE